jgi:hypothetical protein
VLTSERDAPFTTADFARMIDGRVVKLSLKAHPRHQGAASVPRPREHSVHGALYRAVTDAVQEILARRALAEVCVARYS